MLTLRADSETEYYTKDGLRVRWMAHKRTCRFHATTDGVFVLCGARIVSGSLVPPEDVYPSVYDPSDDLMTCDNCAGLVFRKRPSV